MADPKEKRRSPANDGFKLAPFPAILIFVFSWLTPCLGYASADWFIDPVKYHISAHGQMGCLECHDSVPDQDPHPDSSKVTESSMYRFEADRCFMCHDQVMEDLGNGTHGKKRGVDSKVYKNCVFCHNPHYVLRQGENRPEGFRPAVPAQKQCGVCHEEQKSLPPASEDSAPCLKCHQPQKAQEAAFVCQECHFAKKSGEIAAMPLIDSQAYEKTPHAKESCLTCHPGAAAYNHGRQPRGDCLDCHARHNEATAHDAHATVACQACHLPDAVPVKDFATKKIGWTLSKPGKGPSRVHEFIASDEEETCRRCHFSGNRIGAAAMVLPAKSMICMPCHAATFTVKDTTSIIALLIFLVGLVSAVGFWVSGAMPGTGSRLGRFFKTVFGAVFSSKIKIIVKALFLDGLLQRRLFKHSSARWAVHALIFWPFVFRFVWGLLGLCLTTWWPECSLGQALVDKNHPATAFLYDLSGLSILVGAGAAMARRFLADSKGKIINLPSQDRLALSLLGGIVVVGFILEGTRIAMTSAPGQAHFAFIGYIISLFLNGLEGLSEVYGYLWYLHAILTGAFLAYLPFSRMFHILMGPLAAAVKAVQQEEHHHPESRSREN